MANPSNEKSSFWKEYFSSQIKKENISNTRKLDFSNDRVRFQTYGWMLEAMGPITGLSCLDAGCGTGELAVLMACLGAKVDAFDLAEPAIKTLESNHPEVRWFVADLTDLDNSTINDNYDVIITSEVLQHVDAPAAIQALWKQVSPGGRLIGIMPNASCPIVIKTTERFEGNYNGIHIEELVSTAKKLIDVELFSWRGAGFLDDQRLLPYGLTPWFDAADTFEGTPPNRLQFVVQRKPV